MQPAIPADATRITAVIATRMRGERSCGRRTAAGREFMCPTRLQGIFASPFATFVNRSSRASTKGEMGRVTARPGVFLSSGGVAVLVLHAAGAGNCHAWASNRYFFDTWALHLRVSGGTRPRAGGSCGPHVEGGLRCLRVGPTRCGSAGSLASDVRTRVSSPRYCRSEIGFERG